MTSASQLAPELCQVIGFSLSENGAPTIAIFWVDMSENRLPMNSGRSLMLAKSMCSMVLQNETCPHLSLPVVVMVVIGFGWVVFDGY